MTRDDHLTPGAVLLGKYRVERVLGTGGMAMVIGATHVHLHDRFAIKLLLPEMAAQPEVAQRFLREAQAAVRLKGEHVARVIDVGTMPWGAPYIVLEHLDGHDLAAEIAQRGALPIGEAVDHVLQVCEAMAEAHGLGIVHRDLKPSNCFLTRRPDGSPLIKVLDFGISKAPLDQDRQLTRTHAVMGTPAYMSPEQMRASRDADARSDIWSIGVLLHECVTGRRPFDGDTMSAICLKVAVDPLPPLPAFVPRGIAAVVARCLEKAPDDRYPDVAALAAALAPHAMRASAAAAVVERTAGMRAPTTLSGSTGVVTAPRRRHRWAALLVGTLAVIAGGAALLLLANEPDAAPPVGDAVVAPPLAPIAPADAGVSDAAVDAAPPDATAPTLVPTDTAPSIRPRTRAPQRRDVLIERT